jgi:O-methyltransferase involved in polyketide biosynthesis
MTSTPEFGSLRSEDDQWDIVSGVGYTALLVAGWRALHAASPQPLVRDEFAKHFIIASADSYLTGLLANPGTLSHGSTACKPGSSTTSSGPPVMPAYARR